MKLKLTFVTAALAVSSLVPFALAQTPTGSLHGHVQNYAGIAVKSGEVRLTTDRSSDEKSRKYAYTFPVDAQGNFKGAGIKPDDYVLFYYDNNKSVDFLEHIAIKAGIETVANDDMARPEFLKTLTPEDKKALEEFKKKNADVTATNAKVANVNAILTKARDEMKASNYDAALTDMQQATTIKPEEPLLWFELGNAQLGSKKYDDATTSFKKAVDLNTTAKKPSLELTASAYNQLGQAYARDNKLKEASDAYESAAKAEPARAGMYYFNEAATLYNVNNRDEAGAAADKAIAADPAKADAYYIKAQSLIGKSTVDAKSQKIIPPAGCVEAYEKYLDLQPNGTHAAEIKQIVAAFDDKVISNYKAGKKK